MSKKLAEMFGALAEGLENAAAAARKIEGEYGNADAKSPSGAADGVAGKSAGSKGSKGAAAPAVAGKSAKAGKAAAPAVTFDDVKAKLTELMEAKGKQEVKELLSEFGAAKLADLDEGDYTEVHAKAVEKLAAEEDGDGDGDDDDMFGN
jgi:hypothetical protein